MEQQDAADAAGRVWAAGLRDGHGRRVYVVVAERVAAVQAPGTWPKVRDHENRHLDEPEWAAGEHRAAAEALITEVGAGTPTTPASAPDPVGGES
jgi:hypothetical protein